MGALGEVSEERGNINYSCRKFLPSGGPSSASFGGGNMGLDGNNAEKSGGGTCGFLYIGYGDVGA